MHNEPIDLERMKAIAARHVERLDRDEKFAAQEVATHARWLTASLFAANSAGVALASARLGSDGVGPGFAFVLGIGASLLSGNALQHSYRRYLDYLHEADIYWSLVKMGDPRDRKVEGAMERARKRSTRWDRVAPILGWTSGLLFLAGAMATGIAMIGIA